MLILRKALIVGIDPGITIGIAAIDIDCKIVSIKSMRRWENFDIIKFILLAEFS